MKLYGIANCNTVKNARVWLADHAVVYEFHDFKKHGLTAECVQTWLAQVPWETLVNRRGLTWRGLSEAEKLAVCDADTALTLMLAKPSVIKRPILEQADRVLCVGFDSDTYQRTTR